MVSIKEDDIHKLLNGPSHNRSKNISFFLYLLFLPLPLPANDSNLSQEKGNRKKPKGISLIEWLSSLRIGVHYILL